MVTLMGRDGRRLSEAAESLATTHGVAVRVSVGSVDDEDAVAAAVAEAAGAAAGLRAVVANAGVGVAAPALAWSADVFGSVWATNVVGTALTLRHAADVMARGDDGAICAVSSVASQVTSPWSGPYAATKAAVDSLVRTAADELAAVGVRVNAVLPGLTLSEVATPIMDTPPIAEQVRSRTPLGRPAEVAEIARVVRFLCSAEASYVTGVALAVDGGLHLRQGYDYGPLVQPRFPDIDSRVWRH